MAQSENYLLANMKTLGQPHRIHIKKSRSACNLSTQEVEMGIPGDCCTASLAELVSSRFSKRPCHKKIRWRETKEDTGVYSGPPNAHSHIAT